MSSFSGAGLSTASLLFAAALFVSAEEPGGTAGALAKPQYGAWGFDAAGAELASRPGNDFFRYASGAWLDRVQIPADKPAYSLRLAMTDLTERRLREMLEEAAASAGPTPIATTAKVGAFYKAFIDERRIY